MGVGAYVIVSLVFVSLGHLALWAITTRREDTRIRQLEKQQSVDSLAFAGQARIHHRKLGDMDLRMQYMAREMVSRDELAKTWHGDAVDRDRATRP